VELCNPSNPFSTWRQERCSEMKCVLLLAEAGTSDHADSSGIEKTESIELVGWVAIFLRRFDGLGWEVDCWKEVHRSLERLVTLHVKIEQDLLEVHRTPHPPSP
jgi:hypothetical protein